LAPDKEFDARILKGKVDAGADFIMIGGLIAGTEESGNEVDWVKKWGKKKYLKHYGMSTHYARERTGTDKKGYLASEGRITHIPNKGPLNNLVSEILGGLRSCGTYIGAASLKEFSRCATFTRVNRVHSNMQYNIGDSHGNE
jgi:GMP reductase